MRHILLVILVLAAISAQGQDLDDARFRTTWVAVASAETDWEWGEWEESNVLVVFTEDGKRIYLYNSGDMVLDVTVSWGKDTSHEYEPDGYVTFYTDAVDDTRSKLEVRVKIWNDGTIHLYLYYDAFFGCYQMEKI